MTYAIGGARGRIEDVERTLDRARRWAGRDRDILLADARVVFGRDHLESAVRHAIRSKSADSMAARSLSMETLRYLSGRRQVQEAIRVAGIRSETDRIALVLFGSGSLDEFLQTFSWARDDRVLDLHGKDLADLGIQPAGQKTVPTKQAGDLALERVALLDVES